MSLEPQEIKSDSELEALGDAMVAACAPDPEFEPRIDIYHLCNGTNVVARTIAIDNEAGVFLMEKPLELHVMPTERGVRSSFSAWLGVFGLFPALEHHPIDNADLLLVRPVPEKLAEAYLEYIGEKRIATPQSKLIVPGQ